MTRIVAGSAGGRTLQVPRSGTRPTSDRVREAIFSRLEHAGAVVGARVLDLYCGSGALGLEAASRGALSVLLVDSGKDAADIARRNARELRLAGVTVVRQDAARFAAQTHREIFDLVFLDPPYDVANGTLESVLVDLAGSVCDDATVVVERSARTPEPSWPTGWQMLARDYGETRVYIGGPAEEPAPTPASGGLPLPT